MYEHELRRLRQTLAANRLSERNHDAHIEALWQENQELKVYLRALIHLLTAKRVITGSEVAEMVRMIERSATPEERPGPGSLVGPDNSPELDALRKAVEETSHEHGEH